MQLKLGKTLSYANNLFAGFGYSVQPVATPKQLPFYIHFPEPEREMIKETSIKPGYVNQECKYPR